MRYVLWPTLVTGCGILSVVAFFLLLAEQDTPSYELCLICLAAAFSGVIVGVGLVLRSVSSLGRPRTEDEKEGEIVTGLIDLAFNESLRRAWRTTGILIGLGTVLMIIPMIWAYRAPKPVCLLHVIPEQAPTLLRKLKEEKFSSAVYFDNAIWVPRGQELEAFGHLAEAGVLLDYPEGQQALRNVMTAGLFTVSDRGWLSPTPQHRERVEKLLRMMTGVKEASVVYSPQAQDGIFGPMARPTAAVQITTQGNRRLTDLGARCVQLLVANSFPILEEENVLLTDQNGWRYE